MDEDSLPSGPSQTYARRVGQRLRAIRRQKGMSLQEVESTSNHEFKASVLGAYERGERIISVPRLQRLGPRTGNGRDEATTLLDDCGHGISLGDRRRPEAGRVIAFQPQPRLPCCPIPIGP